MNLHSQLKLNSLEGSISGNDILTDNFGKSPIEVLDEALDYFPVYSVNHFIKETDRILNLNQIRTACVFGHKDSILVRRMNNSRINSYVEYFRNDNHLNALILEITENISKGPLQYLNIARGTVSRIIAKSMDPVAIAADGVNKSGLILHLAKGFFTDGYQGVTYFELRVLSELAKKDQSIFDSMPVIIVADLPNSDLCL